MKDIEKRLEYHKQKYRHYDEWHDTKYERDKKEQIDDFVNCAKSCLKRY